MDMLGGPSQNNMNSMSFPSAQPAKDDGGFGDFQASNTASQPINMQSGTNPTNMTQQTINIQNLYQMYNANAHSANDKYSALDSMVPGGNMQNQNNMMGGFGQAQSQQQQKQPFQPMVGQMQGFGGMQQNNMMGGGMQNNMMGGGMGGFAQGNAFGGQQQQQ